MKKKSLIEWQNLKEIRGNSESYSETHPRHTQKGKLGDRFDFVTEDTRANPDSLREDETLWPATTITRPQEIMGEAIEHLQGRQKEVYLLTMRAGKSIAEAGTILGISKGTAQVYRDRAVKFIRAYCKLKIENGALESEPSGC